MAGDRIGIGVLVALDYRPLNLSAFCNAEVDHYRRLVDQTTGSYLEARAEPLTGRQELRGFPFQIGSLDGSGESFIVPALAPEGVEVPVDHTATGILFCHVVLGTDLWTGATVGREVGRYTVRRSDATEIIIPIRERLEIGNMPLPWGQYPLLCVPDRYDEVVDRQMGSYDRAGFRQTEIQPSSPGAYFLWYWLHSEPDIPIASIHLQGASEGLLIAAITLCHADEEPLRLRARRTARIRLDPTSPPIDGQRVSVGVDRGLATYPHALPAQPLDAGLQGLPGWGAVSEPGHDFYVDVAAAPSAFLDVSVDGASQGRARWADIQARPVTNDRVAFELIDPGRNWVRVTVVDETTGLPTPCRISFQTPEGVPHAPHGHHSQIYGGLDNWNVDIGGDVRLGQVTYAYIDGHCEGWLPRGPLIVDVARGFETTPLRARVTIERQQRELTVSIRRWTDMNAAGWYSGDTHVHFLSSQGALREAAGEDLNVVNLLQTQWGHLFTNTEDFTGRALQSADGRHTVWVSQENREHLLGHLGLLGLRKPVMPWATGGPGEGELGGALETTLARWADAAHAAGGTVVLAHFPTPNAEAPVLVATGRADAVEMYDQLEYEHTEYYRYLNDGYRLPLVAGTDKMSSSVPVGLYRTYVHTGTQEPFTFDRWASGIKQGRTFITSGPMLKLTVDGRPIGDTIRVASGAMVEVECEASSVLPMQTLQLIERGEVIDAADVGSSSGDSRLRTVRLSRRVRIDGPTWFAARCGGPHYAPLRHFDGSRRGIMAHTSPVYVAIGETYRLRNDSTSQYMLSLIAGGREYIRAASAQYQEGSVTHGHGREDHIAYLEEPFLEAERLIHERS